MAQLPPNRFRVGSSSSERILLVVFLEGKSATRTPACAINGEATLFNSIKRMALG